MSVLRCGLVQIVLSPRSRSFGIRWLVRTRPHNAIVRHGPGIMADGIINETSLRLIWDRATGTIPPFRGSVPRSGGARDRVV